jgi:hypothetical protein
MSADERRRIKIENYKRERDMLNRINVIKIIIIYYSQYIT